MYEAAGAAVVVFESGEVAAVAVVVVVAGVVAVVVVVAGLAVVVVFARGALPCPPSVVAPTAASVLLLLSKGSCWRVGFGLATVVVVVVIFMVRNHSAPATSNATSTRARADLVCQYFAKCETKEGGVIVRSVCKMVRVRVCCVVNGCDFVTIAAMLYRIIRPKHNARLAARGAHGSQPEHSSEEE